MPESLVGRLQNIETKAWNAKGNDLEKITWNDLTDQQRETVLLICQGNAAEAVKMYPDAFANQVDQARLHNFVAAFSQTYPEIPWIHLFGGPDVAKIFGLDVVFPTAD